MEQNPVGLDGMEFIEYCGPSASQLETLFGQLGFTEIGTHKTKKFRLFRQGDINFLLNEESVGFSSDFGKAHGLSICSTGFRVHNAEAAFKAAIERGAKPYTTEDDKSFPYPAVYGIGDSLIYFIEDYGDKNIYDEEFAFR